jgi:hypothetical protein
MHTSIQSFAAQAQPTEDEEPGMWLQRVERKCVGAALLQLQQCPCERFQNIK